MMDISKQYAGICLEHQRIVLILTLHKNMKQVYQKIGYWSGVVAVSAVLAMTLHYVGAWVEPSTTPPSSNVGAPINTGSSGQYKAGALGVGGVLKAYGGLVVGSNLSPTGKYEDNGEGDYSGDGYIAARDMWIADSGKWASDGASLSCVTYSGSGSAYCKSGEVMTGGSCYGQDYCSGNDSSAYGGIFEKNASNNDGIRCTQHGCTTHTAYVRCCK